jgi:catechol 2,3-dioxygenase-like lactoylglutathione lyase family enzyme
MTEGSSTRTEPWTRDPLIGEGHGLDHVIIIVENLARASQDFREKLGFTLEAGSRFPSGVENRIIGLVEHEYVELIALYNRQSGHADVAEIERFLSKGEGAGGAGIRVSSAEETAAHLRQNGFQVEGPKAGSTTYPGIEEVPPVLWRFVQLKTGKQFLDDPFFFVEYVEGAYRDFQSRHPELPAPGSRPNHPNSALGGLHAWLATTDLEETATAYEAIGFPRIRGVKFDGLMADAVELRVGAGSFVILGSASSGGPVEEFLKRRSASYGLMGLSLGVRSLETALEGMHPGVASRVEPGVGLFGKGILVPPDSAHGVWLELFEPHRPGGASDQKV